MMTTRMHERYQFIVVPFCLVGALMEDDIRLFISYILLTVITCINQAALLIAYNGSYENIVDSEFGNILTSMSVVNIFIMLFMLYSVLRLCYFGKRGSKRPDSDPQTETQ